MSSTSSRLLPAGLALLALIAAGAAGAQEPQLLNDGAGGELELAGESRLVLSGLRGTFALRLGKEGSLVYAARQRENRREDLPVALWLEGSTLRLSRLDENDTRPVYLEIAVPPGLDVEADIDESHVNLSGLMSGVRIVGRALEVRAGGLTEAIRLRLEGGTVRMETLSSDVELEGRDFEARLKQIGGRVGITASASQIEAESLAADMFADLDDSTLVATTITGHVQVTAEGGSVRLSGVRRGAELQLGETPLSMTDVEGGVDLETEADVEFRELKSELDMVSFGGGLRGQGNAGGVRVNTDGAAVLLEGIQGAVTVEGRDLHVQLRDMRNEVRVVAGMSSVLVEHSAAAVHVENDFGDVVMNDAAGPVTVRSRDGMVRIEDLKGSLDLIADGPEVRVGWSEIGQGNSTVKSERGDVSVGLPARGRCRVEAIARFGRVDSDLPGVRVSDDGKFANGLLGGADEPVISIDSGGAVYIGASSGPAGG
jgi:hypothetical protein